MTPNQVPVLARERMLAEMPALGFDCGDCTACCTVLAVTELQKPMRFACQHLCRDGCRTYLERPSGCRQFNCLWLRGALLLRDISESSVPIESTVAAGDQAEELLRPDHSGVIWDYFIDGKDKHPCLVAFEVWTDAFGRTDILEFLQRVSDQFPLRLSFRDGQWAEVTSRKELTDLFESRVDMQ